MDKLNQKQKAFSTIELMIALAIMSIVLTAVVLVSFGNQSYLIGSQTSNEAMKLAQGLIEEQQALGRKDFNLVNSKVDDEDPFYDKNVSVKLLSDFLTKEVKTIINWKGERGQDKNLELTTLISNFDTPQGGNTCDSDLFYDDSNLPEDWSDPEVESIIDFSTITPASTYTITDVDVYKERLYVTVGKTDNINDPTFFIFNVENPANPILEDKIDNADVTFGLNAVRVSENPANNNKTYAYVASNTKANYTSCVPSIDPACGQLYIFDVSDDNISSGKNLKILSNPTVLGQIGSGQVQGASIFYKNSYVFLGLTSTEGPEFHIFDVHNPETINSGSFSPVGSFPSPSLDTNNTINAVFMRNSYAYLATPNTEELQILNIANPSTPTQVGSFNSTDGQNGKNLYLVGDKLYLTKTQQLPSSTNDFYILDNSNPASTLPELGGKDLGTSVNAVIVRDYLSFLLTKTSLKIFETNLEDVTPNVMSWGEVELNDADSGASVEPSMDCEGNRLYISFNDSMGQGKIHIVKAND